MVHLVSRRDNILTIEEVDIKPNISDADLRQGTRKGWLENKVQRTYTKWDDSRFAGDGNKDRQSLYAGFDFHYYNQKRSP